MMQRFRARDDAGMTLIELLLASVISVIITSVVGASFVIAMKSTKDSGTKLGESHDAQLVSVYLPSDLLSVSPSGVDTSPGASSGCASSPGTNVLKLTWSETTGGGTTNFVADYRILLQAGEWRLVRYYCNAVGATTGVTPEALVVAHGLQPEASGRPVVVTDPAGSIALTITDASGYSYTVKGAPRTLAAGLGSPTATPTSTPGPSPTLAPLLPFATGYEKRDDDHDGKIEKVVVTFSANVPAACGATNVEVIGTPGGRPQGTTTPSGKTVTATIDTPIVDTAATALRVSLTGSGSCTITPTATPQPAEDKAAPVLIALTTTNAGGTGGAGRIETGDALVLRFSEQLSGLPLTSTVGITDTSVRGSDRSDFLSASGLLNGEANLGSDSYVTGNGKTVSFAATLATAMAAGEFVVTATLGASACNACGNAGTGGPSPLAGVLPATALADLAAPPNPVVQPSPPYGAAGFQAF